jgi:hypothetical protein
MGEIVAQASFNSGEWSPNLFARVDLQKYKSGAALLENFYIDYRGGASTRPGSKYVLQAYKSATAVRLIPFQASFSVGYVLEFGDHYIRFFYQGSPIVETGIAITAATLANPCVLTIPGHAYSAGDWIYVSGVVGMTQLNGRYFSVQSVAGDNVTIGDLNGVNINSTGYTAYTSGGTSQRVYTLTSPYAAADLELLKFAQSTNEMVICHPNYVPYLLAVITATNWSISAITFGSTATAPTGVSISTTLGGGSVNYSYGVTSIDSNGQESSLSSLGSLTSKQDIRTVAGSNSISWTAATTAVAYNVYESSVSYFGVVPAGVSYGFIGTCKGTTFIDSNIGADFSQSPPIAQNPFVGNGISYITVGTAGTYTTVPTVSFSGGSPSIPASAIGSLGAVSTPTITAGGTGYVVGDTVNFGNGLVLTVTSITNTPSAGIITGWSIAAAGSITTGSTPSNPLSQVATSGSGTGAEATVTWGVVQVIVLTQGAGYSAVPTVVFSAGSAAATAVLTANSNGNPSVPSFFQQRLVLAAPAGAPQTFYMSQPGSYFNFNITDPVVASNAITETLVSGVLNTIKSIVSSTAGMLVLTDKSTWLINGGTSGSAVSPTAIVANLQSNVGASDVPPIVANYDVLFVQSKGSAVRDLTYNIYFNVFTGTDISITASHLFFGYTINEWAWAESPFYVVWAVRSDGVMLTLTFLKEQEFVGWSHQVTSGLYKSVCAVTEATSDAGNVDAVYTCVQRTINGNTVQYIERITDRAFPNGLSSAWCVDSGLQYTGAAQLSFQGGENLNGATVTGLATDDLGNVTVITPFVMPVGGFFTLPAPSSPATGYTTVTIGLGFTCKLQTLAIDTNKAMIQGKLKKIDPVVARVVNTLGLSVGPDFNYLVPMKDLIQGNVNSMLTGQQSQVVSGLYTGDARIYISPTYTVPGQYCLQQSQPLPATVLGLFPTLITEDDP